jgi:hypothetical protein
MSTHGEIDRAERMIVAMVDLAESLDTHAAMMAAHGNALNASTAALVEIAKHLQSPSPGWRRMLDEFKGAVSRIPTTLRARF